MVGGEGWGEVGRAGERWGGLGKGFSLWSVFVVALAVTDWILKPMTDVASKRRGMDGARGFLHCMLIIRNGNVALSNLRKPYVTLSNLRKPHVTMSIESAISLVT